MGSFGTTEIILVVAVLFLLFGREPSAAACKINRTK